MSISILCTFRVLNVNISKKITNGKKIYTALKVHYCIRCWCTLHDLILTVREPDYSQLSRSILLLLMPWLLWLPGNQQPWGRISINCAIALWKNHVKSLWRHRMEPFSALMTLSEGNPAVTGGFPSQRPSDVELWCFLWSRLACTNCWTNSQEAGESGCLVRSFDITVMTNAYSHFFQDSAGQGLINNRALFQYKDHLSRCKDSYCKD